MSVFLRRRIIRFLSRVIARFDEARRQEWEQTIKESLGSCGQGVRLMPTSQFIDPANIHIGNNVHIGCHGWFRGDGGLRIGENTHISRNCALFTAGHNYQGERLPYDETYIKKAVAVGRNVWIGMHVSIIPGVTIGDGAIVGLGTVVVQDVPPLAIIGAQKHRILKHRDKEHYERLDRQGSYGGKGGMAFHE